MRRQWPWQRSCKPRLDTVVQLSVFGIFATGCGKIGSSEFFRVRPLSLRLQHESLEASKSVAGLLGAAKEGDPRKGVAPMKQGLLDFLSGTSGGDPKSPPSGNRCS